MTVMWIFGSFIYVVIGMLWLFCDEEMESWIEKIADPILELPTWLIHFCEIVAILFWFFRMMALIAELIIKTCIIIKVIASELIEFFLNGYNEPIPPTIVPIQPNLHRTPISQLPSAQIPAAKIICIACSGSGQASNGSRCHPCNGSGVRVLPPAEEIEGDADAEIAWPATPYTWQSQAQERKQ